MKLVTFTHHGAQTIGLVAGDRVIDVAAADPSLPTDMIALIRSGGQALDRVRAIDLATAPSFALADVHLDAPVLTPSKYLAIGMNYRAHVKEALSKGVQVPDTQVWFNKQVSCINGPFDDVHKPRASDHLDYEAELAVVIGRRCRHVPVEHAKDVVFGYTIANDVSVRDWQLRSSTFTLGKSWDTHGPIGPWIVTADELPEPHGLRLRMRVNGEVRQDITTDQMLANVWEQIAHLSTVMTLEPGDLIATGTPSGVGLAMQPPTWLKVGDVMRVEVEGIGHIENRVVAEPESTVMR